MYTLFPVDQTICDVLREAPYEIKLTVGGVEKVWYDCDDLEAFEQLWDKAGKKISDPIWEWELNTFVPSDKARALPRKYR